MTCGHASVAIFDAGYSPFWRISRVAFPLFCFVLSCHLVRGKPLSPYLYNLILLAVISQPVYAFVLQDQPANILFTLAAGACVADKLRRQNPTVQHVAMALAVIFSFASPTIAKMGVDYGIDGIFLPAAILLVLEGRRDHLPWLLAITLGLNWNGEHVDGEAWLRNALIDAVCACVGSVVILSAAVLFKNRARFLPRYALHIYYPAHLVVLAGIGLFH